jgi:hypothetical protein
MAAYKKADIILYISFIGGPILTLYNARHLQLHTRRPPKLPQNFPPQLPWHSVDVMMTMAGFAMVTELETRSAI